MCQESCLCNSQFGKFCLINSLGHNTLNSSVFIGTLLQTFHDPHTRLYRHYFKIARFIKYDNAFTGRYHAYESYICSNRSNILDVDPLPSLRNSFVPTEGVVKVYSKNPSVRMDEHFIAGSLHFLHGKKKLVLCCVDEDASFAVSVLQDAMFRQLCKC